MVSFDAYFNDLFGTGSDVMAQDEGAIIGSRLSAQTADLFLLERKLTVKWGTTPPPPPGSF